MQSNLTIHILYFFKSLYICLEHYHNNKFLFYHNLMVLDLKNLMLPQICIFIGYHPNHILQEQQNQNYNLIKNKIGNNNQAISLDTYSLFFHKYSTIHNYFILFFYMEY